jgi:hypothetical protein
VADYTGPAPTTADVQSFRINLWDNIKANNRCGGCHNATGQAPRFARNDDVNLAYADANTIVNLTRPDQSLVPRWAAATTAAVEQLLADILTTDPQPRLCPVGTVRCRPERRGRRRSRRSDTVRCGAAASPTPSGRWCAARARARAIPTSATQSPFFASADVNEAYAAARSKLDLDTPANSRLVVRVGEESHNCWTTSCTADAATMLARINQFVNGIQIAPVDPNLVLSKALTLYDGTVAAGGNRFETSTIAKYEFKTGTGSAIFDTSGVEPALNLNMSGDIA